MKNINIYKNNTVVLWGAGLWGTKFLNAMKLNNINIFAFCDNKNHGRYVDNVPIISPDELIKIQSNPPIGEKLIVQIAISPIHSNYDNISNSIMSQAKSLGIKDIINSRQGIETLFLPIMIKELNITEFEAEKYIEECVESNNVIQRIWFIVNNYKRLIPQKPLKSFILNIIDHCNLNCQRCDHFSSISDPYFVNIKNIEPDLKQMSNLLNQSLECLKIEGGEALLHPDLIKIMNLSRKYFPHSEILLMTNGLLLLKQNQEFWDCCRHNNIVMSVTKYPVNFDYDKAQNIANKNRVGYKYFSGENVVKTSFKLSFDESGNQNPKISFANCHRANNCLYLMEGKFYHCPVISNTKYLNKMFGTNFVVNNSDYIDIYKINSSEELTKHVSKPTGFCKYCATTKDPDIIPWAVSKKLPEEWLM